MINSVQAASDFSSSGDDRRRESSGGDKQTKSPPAQKSAGVQPEVRLIIEEDKSTGAFIYKLIDRTTGAVVSQVSREDIVKMGQDPDYSAGQVINTEA